MADKKINLSENLSKLSEIADWFDGQDEVDVEEGLKKVKEASALIKDSRARLQEVENEFQEIKRDMDSGTEEEAPSTEDTDLNF